MDEKDQELQDFDLDDIMKEFSDGAEADSEYVVFPDAPAQPEASDEDMPELDIQYLDEILADAPAESDTQPPDAAAPQEPAPASVTEDTIRLDDLAEVHTEAEDCPPAAHSEVQEQAVPAPEPYSDSWEPEYEQPIGEYIPPQPIIFHPRSRLRELKRKLIAGPEKRYYELTEVGLGKLQLAIFFSLLTVLLSAGATALNAMGMVQANRMRLMVFIQFFTMLVAALFGSFQLLDGVSDMFRGRFSLNSLLVFTFIACCVDGVLCLEQVTAPCCAAFALEMTMSLWSAYHRRSTELGQMDTMRKATRLDSLSASPDFFEGRNGLLRGEGQVEDFMDTYNVPTGPEKVCSWYAVAALLASIGIGITAGVLHGYALGVRALAVSLLAASPATFFITLSRPMAVLERRLHRLGTVLCGWRGIKGLCKKSAFPLSHTDLFPAGATKLNGVKFYGTRDPDEVVAYGTALISADGGGLAPLFNQLLDSRNGRHYDAENLRSYAGGIGGEINGEPVLVGVLSCLRDMGVEIPEGMRVNQAVYLAIDGELCGLFAITYNKVRTSAAGLSALCGCRKVKPVLTTGDFMLTDSFLRAKFGINPRRIAFPERQLRAELEAKEPDRDSPALALTTQEGLASMAYAVTGARSLRTAWRMGLIIHMLGGIVGLLMMLALAILGEASLLTPANMFLYELVWMIPGLLITEWTR